MRDQDRYPVKLSSRLIRVTEEDRQLLRDADAISRNLDEGAKFTKGRLMLMKDACQRYSLGMLQRIVKQQLVKARD